MAEKTQGTKVYSGESASAIEAYAAMSKQAQRENAQLVGNIIYVARVAKGSDTFEGQPVSNEHAAVASALEAASLKPTEFDPKENKLAFLVFGEYKLLPQVASSTQGTAPAQGVPSGSAPYTSKQGKYTREF